MENARNLFATFALSVGLLTVTGANAALESALGGQVVNDTDLNITWLADANLAATETFGVSGINANGTMTWNTAQSWIGAMNASNYLGFNDWRLPTSLSPVGSSCTGYLCSGSEMGHLYYFEGGLNGQSIASSSILNEYFTGMQSDNYWNYEYAPLLDSAWSFSGANGWQNVYPSTNEYFAWAVRSGEVVSAVPEPQTYGMLLTGLAVIGFTMNRRKQSFTAV